MVENIKAFWKKEIVLCVALLLAISSSLIRLPRMEYIDTDVLSILLSLMLVVAGLKSIRVLDWVAVELINKCHNMRQLEAVLLGITFLSSMFVTNDVALITFVPLALVVGTTLHMDVERTIILQTLAANLGSMLTPLGNPQNLFLYAHFGYTPIQFFRVMALPCLLSCAFITVLWMRSKKQTLTVHLAEVERPARFPSMLWFGLLVLNIAAVLHAVDKLTALLITVFAVAVWKRSLFKQVDYSLLITFIGFFVFIGNISNLGIVCYLQEHVLGSAPGTYLAGLFESQLISNVPAAMLLAGVTLEKDALLLGVNIGGLGTLIASMASVISYKLFVEQHPSMAHRYMRTFLCYNFAGLALLGTATYVFCIM